MDMKIKLLIYLLLIAFVLPAFLFGCNNSKNDEGENSVTPRVVVAPIDASVPTNTKTATFALGWFWGPDSRFGSIDGVIRTRVGYAGGTSNNPTYYNLGDHSETIQIDYDPTQISYDELLDVFWDSHDPTVPPFSQQYKSVIFYHNEAQKRLAIESKEQEEARLGRKIVTEIIPFSKFYLAEDYHQKYYLQQEPELMKDFNTIYPDTKDFISSTAVARVNGYVGGYGILETLQEVLSSFGLSERGSNRLTEIADRGLVPGCALPWITSFYKCSLRPANPTLATKEI